MKKNRNDHSKYLRETGFEISLPKVDLRNLQGPDEVSGADLTVPEDQLKARAAIYALEVAMLAKVEAENRPGGREAFPPFSLFANGLYLRMITITKGSRLVGVRHRKDKIDIMINGDMTVWTEEGVQRLTGFGIWRTPAGNKRVGVAHEDTTWITVHSCDEKDVDSALDDIILEEDPHTALEQTLDALNRRLTYEVPNEE